MTELFCSAIHCASNRDSRCCRPQIKVGGDQATESGETCCTSFRPVRDGVVSAADFSRVNQSVPITCEAVTCAYNEQSRCRAESVQVAGSGAREMYATRCKTFRCRE
jgi:hypothetical protein